MGRPSSRSSPLPDSDEDTLDLSDLRNQRTFSVEEMLDAVAGESGGPKKFKAPRPQGFRVNQDRKQNRPTFTVAGDGTITPGPPETAGRGNRRARTLLRSAPSRRTERVAKMVLGTALGVGALCLGGHLLTLANRSEEVARHQEAQPTVTVTERVTVTVTESAPMSDACIAAIRDAQSLIESASVIGSSQSEILDLLSLGYQGIMLGDTEMINSASQGIRDMDSRLTDHSVPLYQKYRSIMDGLATCPTD